MKLRKELVDELIRESKNYHRTGDDDSFKAMVSANKKLVEDCKATLSDILMLIEHLAMFTQYTGIGTYEDIYKVLEVFGVIVE